jgi:glycosyltransferase involved in cell wall biosynthesis
MNAWRIITGECAPQQGGVADYVAQLARALREAGDAVTVHVPGPWQDGAAGLDVQVLSDRFGPRSAWALREAQRRQPAVMLLQYSPFSLGARGLNVLFPRLLRAVPGPLAVMFHEVAFPREPGQPPRHALLARAQAEMARALLRRAQAACVSTEAWAPTLRALGWRGPVHLLPIPTNLLPPPERPSRDSARAALGIPTGADLLGHFGTYGPPVAGPLAAAVPGLLAPVQRHLLLLGRGAPAFRTRLCTAHPMLAPRLHAPGEERPEAVSRGLLACDALVQPFVDGVTTRRTSLMAGLAHGVPTCTNRGPLTEPLWERLPGISLAADAGPDALASAVDRVLGADRAAQGPAAAASYEAHFALRHGVERLRALAAGRGQV